jgi:4-amino-4-deoxy-L-arabinose transferase-like glycosyltransferase
VRFGQLPDPTAALSRKRIPTASIAGSLAVVLGVLLIWLGQRELASDARALAYLPWLVGLTLVIAVCAQLPLPDYPTVALSAQGSPSGYWGWVLWAFAAGAAIVLWRETQQRTLDDASLDLVVLWMAAIAALTIAVVWPIRRRTLRDEFRHLQQHRAEAAMIAGITLVAFACRTVVLNSYPRVVTGDEGMFGMAARSVLRGNLSNPFASATGGYPSLLFITQAGVMTIAGDSIAGARGQSALLGTGAVLAVYALARHHFGPATALIAATLAATNSFAIFWSRNTQNAIAPMLFYPLALLFLDRGLVGRRRADSLIAGLVIGFAQYFHPGNRILVPLAVVYLAYAVLYPIPRSWSALAASVRSVALPAIVVVSAAVISIAPQFGYYWARPDEYWNRINQVSAFASGWLDREVELTGLSMAHLLWIQFRNAAMLPFSTPPNGLFRPGVPFGSWPMVVPVAIGLGLITATFWRRSSFGFVIGFWSTVVGLALTEGPPATNRYVAAGPFLVVFGALGITSVATALWRSARLPRKSTMLAAGLVTVLIAAWHLHFFFRDPNQIELYADTNAEIATSVARQTERLGPDATLYFLGQPRMYYAGNENMAFLAPDATVFDIEGSWNATAERPALTGPTLFAFVPERLGELNIVRAWFPDGTVTVSTLPDGEEILTTYFVDAPVVGLAGGHSFVLSA